MGYPAIKILYSVATILGTLVIILFFHQKTAVFNLGAHKVRVELAETFSQKAQGLSGRASLDDNSGMLFVYPNKSILHFWMKGMNFPLDAVWLANGRVVGWQENIPAQTDNQITRFQSNAPEVSAGWINNHPLKLGDTAELGFDKI